MSEPSDDHSTHREQGLVRVVVVFTVLVLIALLVWRISDALLILFAAALMALFLDGLARLINRVIPIGHLASLILGLVLIIAGFSGVFLLGGSQITQQFAELSVRLSEGIEWAEDWLSSYSWGRSALIKPPETSELLSGTGDILGQVGGALFSTVGAFIKLPIIFIVGLYLAISPVAYLHGLVLLIPPAKRLRGKQVLRTIGNALRWWLVGQLASMSAVGVLTGIGLWIVGMPMALVLGLITGLLSFIPMLGPILAAIPALLIALTEGPRQALYVGFVYIFAQVLEGNLITPLIQKRTVTLLPAVLILAQLLMGVLFGFAGVVLATPLVVVAIVLIQMLYIQDFLGSRVKVLGQH